MRSLSNAVKINCHFSPLNGVDSAMLTMSLTKW